MPAPLLILCASFLFAAMGLCIKLASAHYATAEIVFYRGLVGALTIAALTRLRGGTLRTQRLAMHGRRSFTGVCALSLWFHALAGLPLATAMTLNYMSSVWMAVFLLLGAALLRGGRRVDARLVAAVLAGFAGVVLVLRPTMGPEQLGYGLAGLVSGMLAASAYLQVQALGRAGEPEYRIVFYFSLGGMAAGVVGMAFSGVHAHSAEGLALLLATGVLATVAQMMMTRAYAIGRTLSNASLQYSGIVFSCLLGALVLGDPLTLTALAGIALIVAAGLAATWLRSQPAGAGQ
ncbi:DMT family transporter [Azohydromonas caseinilytica]|uniref:DMT family transporter n=1 Tax=Azohydromonas caseinilytica TaxID=2728836 RepID=A0A848F3M3_9BURK|nr:DMT family transporter [Azohydromonas caseinilytica]NML13992.1 DMT family transporter [Azohydromonas caseinilytica]